MAVHPIDTVRLYTTEQFMALDLDDGKLYELVRGVLQGMLQPGERHGLVADNLYGELRDFIKPRKLGRLIMTVGFELPLDPSRDTVRSPDWAFLGKGKTTGDNGAVTVPPDLAVEVLSPNDRPAKLKEKLQEYQIAGWDLVWVINPEKQSVEVYRLLQSLSPAKKLGPTDQLDGEEVIPGFSMAVAALFDYDD